MIGLSSFVASPLRLEPPYGDVEGGVDVAHGVEQADQVGRVVGVGRRLGAGTEEQASRKTFEDCEVLVVGGGYILVFGLSGRAAWPAAWSVFFRAGLDVWDPVTA